MIISVASGKGGTGKTTVATNMAVALQGDIQLLDCDVEEPNAHLFIRPQMDAALTVAGPVYQVDMNKCTLCGKCREGCQFKAIVMLGKTVLRVPSIVPQLRRLRAYVPEKAITKPTGNSA